MYESLFGTDCIVASNGTDCIVASNSTDCIVVSNGTDCIVASNGTDYALSVCMQRTNFVVTMQCMYRHKHLHHPCLSLWCAIVCMVVNPFSNVCIILSLVNISYILIQVISCCSVQNCCCYLTM